MSIDFKTGILRLVIAQSDLTPRQIGMLLKCRDMPKTVRGLANELGMSRPAVSRAIDKLQDAKYVKRVAEPGDRRGVMVDLLPSGRKFLDRLLAPVTGSAKKNPDAGHAPRPSKGGNETPT